MSNEIQIGPYELYPITIPKYDENHIYIRHESGEGMSVRESVLAELIGNFYKEHM